MTRKKKSPRLNISRNILLSLCSSLLLVLAFSNINLEFLVWIGLAPLFISLEKTAFHQKFLLFFLFCFFFFLGTVYWLVHVSLLGLLALCVYLSLEFSLFGLLFTPCRKVFSLISIPLIWIGCERLRGELFTGFGWAWLGYTQYKNLLLIQISDKISVLGISFIIVMVNVAITQIFFCKLKPREKLLSLALPSLLISACLGYGLAVKNTNYPGPDISLSLIQGNIPQEEKWSPSHIDKIMQKYNTLTLAAAKESPDLIIWPETSVPGYLMDEPALYREIVLLAQKADTNFLVGSPREDYKQRKYYNSAFLFSGKGFLQLFHDKIHLVPFGEYVPYQEIFRFLDNPRIGDFSGGDKFTVFHVETKSKEVVSFAVLICFEDVFADIVKKYRAQGADLMILMSNEAWFKNSTEPAQHLGISVFRAIENRCWFARCANTGISCFISPRGEILGKIQEDTRDIFVDGTKTFRIR